MEGSINFTTTGLAQLLAVLLTGLLAGLFYGYDCSVVKGLGNLSDEEYLKSFQSINNAIQNPYFFTSFMGNLLVLPLATWLCYRSGQSAVFYTLLLATFIYYIGVFGITVLGNIPLNEHLAGISLSEASPNEISLIRKAFEKPWNTFHTLRTVSAILTFLLTIISILISSSKV